MTDSKKDLCPVYLAFGSDKLKIETVIKRLHERLSNQTDLTMDNETFDAENTEMARIITSCEMFPVLGQNRYILVKNADKFNSADLNQLIDYINKPNKSTILLITAHKLRKNNKLFKAINDKYPSSIINCESPKARDLAGKVAQYARQNGSTIDNNAAIKLIELVGQDTVNLNNEIKKIALASQNYRITIQDVVNNTTQSAEAKPWDFTDAILQRDLDKALNILSTFEPGCEYRLLPATCNTLKELICVQSIGPSANQNRIAQELGMPSAISWKYKNHVRYARNYTRSELRRAINMALICDQKMKSTSDSFSTFQNYIIGIISKETSSTNYL